jgi:hypothetical protein
MEKQVTAECEKKVLSSSSSSSSLCIAKTIQEDFINCRGGAQREKEKEREREEREGRERRESRREGERGREDCQVAVCIT